MNELSDEIDQAINSLGCDDHMPDYDEDEEEHKLQYLEHVKQKPDILRSMKDQIPSWSDADTDLLIHVYSLLVDTDDITKDACMAVMGELTPFMDDLRIDGYLYKLIEKLVKNEWYAAKCAAALIFVHCYPIVSEDNKKLLVEMYLQIYTERDQDVTKFYMLHVEEFLKVVDKSYIVNQVFNLFRDLVKEEIESMKLRSLSLVVPLIHNLDNNQIENVILEGLKLLSTDASWMIRFEIAKKFVAFQRALGTGHNLLQIFRALTTDPDNVVREIMSHNIAEFAELVLEHPDYKVQDILQVVKRFNADPDHAINYNMTENISQLIHMLSKEDCKTHLFPIIINSFSMPQDNLSKINEYHIENLNEILLKLDTLDKYMLELIETILFHLITNPQICWRTRRNLIVTITILSNYCDKNYFTKTVIIFLHKLLCDKIISVRTTTSLIIPMLIKKFGFIWGKINILSYIFSCTNHASYMIRSLLPICIGELVEPTLQKLTENYLENIYGNKERMYKISYLNKSLESILLEEWNEHTYGSDQIWYAEETLIVLSEHKILNIDDHEEDEIYLEALLIFLIKFAVDKLKALHANDIEMVKCKCNEAFKKIRNFTDRLDRELEEDWARKTLKTITKEEKMTFEAEVDAMLVNDETFPEMDKNIPDRGVKFSPFEPLKKYNRQNALSLENKSISIDDIDGICVNNENELNQAIEELAIATNEIKELAKAEATKIIDEEMATVDATEEIALKLQLEEEDVVDV